MRMDIRVAAYSPVTVSTFSRAGSSTATTYVQNAATSGPVSAVAPIQQMQDSTRSLASNPSEGYTDSVRGSLVNILA